MLAQSGCTSNYFGAPAESRVVAAALSFHAAAAGEEGAGGAHRTFRAPRLRAFAELLPVAFQEQVRARARLERVSPFRFDSLLGFTVRPTVVVALWPVLDSH